MRLPAKWANAKTTFVIASVTAAVWLLLWLLNINDIAAVWGGFIPDRIAGLPGDEVLAPVWLTPVTATLVHVGPLHLLLNLLVLLICGRAVEPILGRTGFVILYLVGAYAAAAAQYAANIESGIPMIGASGATSAVLGAYALLFGRNKVKIANPRLAMAIHALWLLAAWIVLQVLAGLTARPLGTNLAVAAHIGGFLVGLALAIPLLLFRYRKA